MNNGVELKTTKDSDLLLLFEELTEKNQRKVALQAMRTSAKIILQQAKTNFNLVKKGKSKTNYKEIMKSFKSVPMTKKVGLRVGIQHYKVRWIEFGTPKSYYMTKNKVKHFIGNMQPTNFFYDAVESKKEEAQKFISDALITSMEKMVKKYDNK